MTGPDERYKGKGRLIPHGELPCIWMEAGLIAYKLCNYEYECERCPFDAEMRKSGPLRKESAGEARVRKAGLEPGKGGEPFAPVPSAAVEQFFYHPGHTWARPESDQKVESCRVWVGVDDFAAKVLPRVKDAILPHRGNTIRQGHVFCWVVCGPATLPIAAPVSGTVVVTNPKLAGRPTLINIDPHGEGWFVLVDPSDLDRELAKLFKGKSAVSWMDNERKKFERLTALLRWTPSPTSTAKSIPEVGMTLADGGERFFGLADADRLKRYMEFITQFFL